MTGLTDSNGALAYAAHRSATTARRAAVHATLDKGLAAPLTAVLGTVLDIAWANPTAAQIKATGATGVIGYLSQDSTKNLSASQVSSYVLAGVRVGTVWETTAGRALAGYAAGQADARAAETQRAAIGLPATSLHRAAVDTDTTWASVAPYFEGWASIVGKGRLAAYGGYKITTGAYGYGLRRNWQTLAWSGGRLDPNAALYQNGKTTLGGDADVNTILAADWGQYPALEAPDMALTDADVKKILTTDNILTGPTDAADHATNPYWTWASHITGVTSGVRTLLKNAASILAQAQANGSALSALTSKVEALTTAVGGLETTALTDAQVAAISAAVGPAVAADLAARLAA